MNRAIAFLLAALALLLPGAPVLAQSAGHGGARVVASVSWVEEWDPATGQWVRVEDSPAAIRPVAYETVTSIARSGGVTITETITQEPVRFISRPERAAPIAPGLAQDGLRYGPFRLLDERRAALVASTDAASPAAFKAMLAAHPGLEVIEFLDAPGTSNDIANLALGRMIRAAGLATHVPDGGSARSGAVELFLAGTTRSMDPRALFAVHSWRDEAGREPADFAPDAPENRLYLDYYADMGMSDQEARAFYAMTNSVPHHSALWLKGTDMARWVAPAAGGGLPRGGAMRSLMPELENGLREALALSGRSLLDALRAPLRLSLDPAPVQPRAPRLAYAGLGAGLLDSVPAFP